MYVMEIIFHVHLTKTDFENIKLLHLPCASFRHLLWICCEQIHIWKIMMIG